MIPVLVGGHALESFLDPYSVVPVDIGTDLGSEFLTTGKRTLVEQFGFQMAKEVFCHSVVVTISFARHRLFSSVHGEDFLPRTVLVLESLISVNHKARIWPGTREGLLQARGQQFQIR